MKRLPHVSPEDLRRTFMGALDAGAVDEILTHAESCPDCAEVLIVCALNHQRVMARQRARCRMVSAAVIAAISLSLAGQVSRIVRAPGVLRARQEAAVAADRGPIEAFTAAGRVNAEEARHLRNVAVLMDLQFGTVPAAIGAGSDRIVAASRAAAALLKGDLDGAIEDLDGYRRGDAELSPLYAVLLYSDGRDALELLAASLADSSMHGTVYSDAAVWFLGKELHQRGDAAAAMALWQRIADADYDGFRAFAAAAVTELGR